jgi:hypothetical protein
MKIIIEILFLIMGASFVGLFIEVIIATIMNIKDNNWPALK